MRELLLSGRDVCRRFSGSQEKDLILRHVNVDIYKGDFTIIMGASGAGKSTLLYALSGMDKITGGKVIYKGQEISSYSENQMAKVRCREFGFVFQQTHLVSNLTLFENAAVAGYLSGAGNRKQSDQKAKQLLMQMHVENAGDRLPSQVSGGEAQRAALVRAMMGGPGLLFADEPTGALNKKNTEDVLNLLTKLNKEGQSILMVTHDLRAAVRGNRILYLEDGAVLDELSLPPFAEGEEKEREEEVNRWLSSMEW